MIIEGHCHTNIDLKGTPEFPQIFSSNIRVGDWVRAIKGDIVLKVVSITHAIKDKKPFIEIELHRI